MMPGKDGGRARASPSVAQGAPRARGRLLIACLLLAVAAPAAAAQPAQYPTRTIRIIVPAAAGAHIDHVTRIIGRELAEAWNHSILIDNRAGGHGAAGQELVANAQPDGHTLLMQSTAFVTLPLFYKLPYDAERDLIPVSRVASSPLVLVAHPSFSARSVKDLITLARGKPGAVRYASYGSGSITHVAGEAFGILAAVKLGHAAQRDVPEAIGEVLTGHVQMVFAEIAYALPHVEAGALRALATTGRVRAALFPALPTLAESGVGNYELTFWLGAFVRAGAPAAATDRIAGELARILEMQGMEGRMNLQGFEKAWLPAAEFQRFVRGESQRLTALLRKAGGIIPR